MPQAVESHADRKTAIARRVAVLGSTVAVLAFTCGFASTKYLNSVERAARVLTLDEESSDRYPLATPHADACSEDSSSQGSACYSETTKTYEREWRLWAGLERDASSWPRPMNEDEEEVHAARFDGVTPLLLVQASSNKLPSYVDGEGGRRKLTTHDFRRRMSTHSEDPREVKVHASVQAREADRRGRRARALTDVHGNLEVGLDEYDAKGATLKPSGEQQGDGSPSASTQGGVLGTGGTSVTATEKDDSSSSSATSDSSITATAAPSATTDSTAYDDDQEAGDAAFSVKAFNSYTKSGGGLSNPEYAWSYVVEPYRATTLEVEDAVEGATYEWTVDGHLQGYGTSVEVLFMEIGYHVVKVEELVSTKASADLAWSFESGVWSLGSATAASVVSNKVSLKLMAKYVRREVRSLSDADREAWLSGVMVMQRVPTLVGQSLYGSKYLSKDHFTRVHLYYGGALDCDHWHQGAGFVTSHVALTLQWEQALQAINPSIAAPYWDFTVESTFFGASDWRSSLLFADDWFGEAAPENDLHTVVSGRWAFVPTMANSQEFTYWTNSYGLMRAPWNSDPTPFLTRSGKVYGYQNNIKPSGCAEYSKALKKTTWMSMSKQLNSAAHGHVHELMGGAWAHYYKEKLGGDTSPAVFTFAHEIQALSKILWRTEYVSCPASCDMTTAASDCQCTCDASSLQGKAAKDVLADSGLLSAAEFFDQGFHVLNKNDWLDENGTVLDPIPGYDSEGTKHIYNSLLSLLCNPGHLGDMYQATSTNDITFWVIHNTVDRLWHFKRLGNLQNYDETWDPYHTCYGHNPRNLQPFKGLFGADGTVAASTHRRLLTNADLDDTNSVAAGGGGGVAGAASPSGAVAGDGSKEGGKAPGSLMADKSADAASDMAQTNDKYYSNMELYEALHPNNRGLQYVYDNFEWPHCSKLGYQMVNTW